MQATLRAFVTARGEEFPDFIETEGNSYVFAPAPLLRIGG